MFLVGALGDWVGGVVTDRLLKKTGNLNQSRSAMVAVCNLLAIASLLPMFLLHDSTVAYICLSFAFFFAEMTIGPMWAIPMDVAPRYAGTASGLMNTGSALAAIVSPVVGGWIIDKTGNWDLMFMGSIALMFAGAMLSFTMKPAQKF